MVFDNARLYRPEELGSLARAQTLANWRAKGKGPPFIKAGGRVVYPGKALNEWLERRVVTPEEDA